MNDRIVARVAELEEAERNAELRLIIIQNLLVELRNLITPDAPIMSGDGITDAPMAAADLGA